MQKDGEPSVEEILESIKKVIARDNRDRAERDRTSRASAKAPSTDEIEDEIADILELGEEDALDIVETGDVASDEDEDFPLTNAESAQAMRDSFAALAMLAQPGSPPQIVRSGETSLESMTREMLRPMLAKWLDDNLPDIVERMVKAEITRIAGKQR